MLTQALRELAEEEEGYSQAHRGMLEDLRKGYHLGALGKIGFRRESVHER